MEKRDTFKNDFIDRVSGQLLNRANMNKRLAEAAKHKGEQYEDYLEDELKCTELVKYLHDFYERKLWIKCPNQ